MSRLRQSLVQHSPFGWDPLDDPLNDVWDAVVRHDRPMSPNGDPADIAVLRRAHALEGASLPSPNFLGDLEQRLRELYPPPVSTPARESHRENAIFGGIPVPPKRQSALPRTQRTRLMQLTVAVIAIVLVTGLAVVYLGTPKSSEPPHIPAATLVEPTMESMVQLGVTPSLFGVPEASAWTSMYFNLIQIDPGKSFTTDTEWYTTIDGPLLILVLSGELTIHPAGPALFYPAYQRDQTPAEVLPGQSISLGPDAAIVYSAVDTATGRNSGSEPVMALQVSIGQLVFGSTGSVGTESAPLDVRNLGIQQDWGMNALPTADVSISIQRLRLAPYDSFVFDPDPELTYYCVFDQFQMDDVRMAAGAIDGLAPNVDTVRLHATSQLTYPDPGPHTVFNFGGETVDFYFFVVEPLPAAGVPAA